MDNRLIDWLVERFMIDWSIDWLIDWVIHSVPLADASAISQPSSAEGAAKHRNLLNAKVLGHPGKASTPVTFASDSQLGSNMFQEVFVPPENSVVRALLNKPVVDSTAEPPYANYDSSDSLSDEEEDNDGNRLAFCLLEVWLHSRRLFAVVEFSVSFAVVEFSVSVPHSNSFLPIVYIRNVPVCRSESEMEDAVTKRFENEHLDPNSYSWAILTLVIVKSAARVVQQVLTTVSVDQQDLPVISPVLHLTMQVLDKWQSKDFSRL